MLWFALAYVCVVVFIMLFFAVVDDDDCEGMRCCDCREKSCWKREKKKCDCE